MPNIRVMLWNIEKLSWNKIQINGMSRALARIIVANNCDLVILLELTQNSGTQIMTALRNALLLADPVRNNWFNYVWMQSQECGGERYGFIVRDLSLIRPVEYVTNPNAPAPAGGFYGTQQTPLVNLKYVRWTTWPAAFPAGPGAGPPALRPLVGLTSPFFDPPYMRQAAKRQKVAFAGQAAKNGGYALGRGSRMPCLTMFAIQGAAALYYVPLVCCHYAAVRSGRNFLGQQQLNQIQLLHICQMFSSPDPNAAGASVCDYLDIDGAARPVENLLLTGDWNVDFLNNDANGNHLQQTNRRSLDALTPTEEGGGSVLPAAAAGNVPAGAAPVVPFTAPFAPPVDYDDIEPQNLRASATTEGTMYPKWQTTNPNPPAVPRGAAFDYFLYGGARPNTAIINHGVGQIDSGDVRNFSANIAKWPAMPPFPAAPALNLGPIALYYLGRNVRRANHAPRLWAVPGAGGALRTQDRWIGARMVSDHLPEVLEFVCP